MGMLPVSEAVQVDVVVLGLVAVASILGIYLGFFR